MHLNLKRIGLYVLSVAALVVVVQACVTRIYRSNYTDVNKLLHDTKNINNRPFLKAHLKNGDVCILRDSWSVDTTLDLVNGTGQRYNAYRKQIFEGQMSLPIDSVAIFETNIKIKKNESGRVAALTILAGIEVALGVLCLTDPKACFGSCPTFYLNEKDNFHYADAEGFSNAILPSMEYGDLDALNIHDLKSSELSVFMKNEALETHCINEVKLLAYPVSNGERVFQTVDNQFYLCDNLYELKQAKAAEGDVTRLMKSMDRTERFSLSDPKNLNSKEEILLEFEQTQRDGDLGLILNFRQTLMTTYLFYNAMGYMGEHVSDVFNILETNDKMKSQFDATTQLLGGIKCYVWNEANKKWLFTKELTETGPIAINRQFIHMGNAAKGQKLKVKLELNKGLWRLDYAALAQIKQLVKPIEISPSLVLDKGKRDHQALHDLKTEGRYLISMPGSSYQLKFSMPAESGKYELFLYSKGYYLEWMRQHWLKDKNMLKLQQMVYQPGMYLMKVAPNYKQYESAMEQMFWDSKIDTKTFSYYDK